MFGLGLGSQTKPCLRVVALITCITLVSMFYLLGFNQPANFTRPHILPIFNNAEKKKEEPVFVKEGYLVWSQSCQIPDMDPHHESIKKLLKPAASIICSRFGPLTYISTPSPAHPLSNWSASYVLKIDFGMVHHYVPSKQNYSCCFSDVSRVKPYTKYNKTADNKFIIAKCMDFKKEVTLKEESEFILVKCNILKNGSKGKEVYSNMHATVPIKSQVKAKLKPHPKDKLNILFVGLDSISRLNLIRTMPKTVSHLRRSGWIEFKGYNKVADNTFPNLMAILTGLNTTQIGKTCWQNHEAQLDDCPYIWKEFSNQGYITAFGEDVSKMSTFNYHKNGFNKPPTDYYLRPYILAAEKKLQLKTRNQLDICLGPTSTTEHLLRYVTDFATTFRNVLYFAFLWINNLSHNNHNTPAAMDFRFLQFFNELAEIGTLNNTMVIFLSDHGMRFGKIRETFIGWLEERLPFFHMWVPHWFRKQNLEVFKNLVINRDRLTSPYDVHETLKDILVRNLEIDRTGNSVEEEQIKSDNVSVACPKCKSLFEEVMHNRTCQDAGITPHWCTCNHYQILSTDGDIVQEAAKFVVSEIQVILQKAVNKTQKSKKCADLKLSQLLNVRGRVHTDSKNKDYVLMIETMPGGALFEATVRQFIETNQTFQTMGTISRINTYKSQSTCVHDNILQMYCYCVNE